MNPQSVSPSFRPRRVVSWWSRLPDLLWPEVRVRDAIRRRADALAQAGVDTAIQFGFHFRFDFAPYFGLLHGYFAEVAEALHERNIRFFDHYSCNLIARPRGTTELEKYHRLNRHHTAIHPMSLDGEFLGYAGYRFNDLREVDVETGEPTYTWAYQAEMFCHTNPDFLAMHEAYLRRYLAEVPADGFQVDDLCRYAYFRACACRHCRERFAREYGWELPPFSDKSFWGDTTRPPTDWGNYDNPAFRDWVRMRHQTHADHLARIKAILGPDRPLMTCCSHSGSLYLNSLGLSYEYFMEPCDWVMLENNGMNVGTVEWSRPEPDAMLHKAIAAAKSSSGRSAPSIACSYALFPDGAQLGWSLSQFWGVCHWVSTCIHGLERDPEPFHEEAELIAPFYRWEVAHPLAEGEDVAEVRIAFPRAVKEAGRRDERGRDLWTRVAEWVNALRKRDIGYRFVLEEELADAERLQADRRPLILDFCTILDEAQQAALRQFARRGGTLLVVPPVDAELQGPGVKILDSFDGANTLEDLIRKGILSPRLRRISGDSGRRLRLRVHEGRLVLHVLNESLEGVPHPTIVDGFMGGKVLQGIRSLASEELLGVEIDLSDLPGDWASPVLLSPELPAPRPVRMERLADGRRIRLTIDLRGVRLYARVQETEGS